MLTRDEFYVQSYLNPPRRGHAVVIGGSMAGMVAARVLSGHYERVTVLERDELPDEPAPRKGLPQARHAHGLLERGRRILERYLPGVGEEILQAGGEMLDATRDLAMLSPAGWYLQCPSDMVMLASSRNLLDWVVRERVRCIPNIRIRTGIDVVGLVRGEGPYADVGGVRIRPRSERRGSEPDEEPVIAADLVVVASGRRSRLPEWLTELGFAAPRETVVNSFQGYASRIYQPPRERRVGWKFLYIQQAPPDEPRGGLVSVIEDGRWLVSLIGGDGDRPPTDESGFLAFARSLRSPAIFEAIRDAEPLSPIFGHRGTENRLRHYDRLWRFPEGLVALGDATCSFNPVYGQGMTCALIGVEVLDRWLREGALHLNSASTSEFQRRLARATKPAWSFATGADYGFRTVEAPRQARSARLIGGYLGLVIGASTRRPWIRVRWAEVLHMLRPPLALFSPRVVATLIWDWLATRKAEGARSGTPGASGEPSAVFGGRRDALRSA